MIFIGCPMWGYKEWVGPHHLFPPRTPPGQFLTIYSQKLSTVEGNTIFYSVPSLSTIEQWVQQTPATFRFCPKVNRSISHEGDLATKRQETLRFAERMRAFGTRLGPLFLQLPPTFTPAQLPQLATFLSFWPTDLRLAVEVRHPDFFRDPHRQMLHTLLQHHQVGLVLLDTRPLTTGSAEEQQEFFRRERKPQLPVQPVVTTDFTFLRYIGHPRVDSNIPLFRNWAQQIGQWLQQGITPYIFCHCPFEVYSPELCFEFYQQLRQVTPLPPLSWTPYKPKKEDEYPAQLRLF